MLHGALDSVAKTAVVAVFPRESMEDCMKNSAFVIVLVLFIATMAYAEEMDFRGVKWGMSKSEVMSTEHGSVFKEDSGRVGYLTEILDEETLLVYYFTDDKLTRARYTLLKVFTNKSNKYYESFQPLVSSLTEKYGKPNKHDKLWKNSLYKGRPSEIGMAIATGGYSEYVQWETKSTRIIAYISGNNFEIESGVEYDSKELSKLEGQQKKNKEMKKL
ncbi:hypothetical protein NNJEOMEG_00552 [Fundidesulfovibrio magnetotacticus]|uniref:Uncharacterized protein n=2 Tax=Fundidesulfovibrio magnetotacticus TaxID=2730080 RepID=A0A6V8LWR9_9BACT|nr:hypothetical protein NNJEOMEG_00552 [Fundidesulfovibrio magnetotacticus]